MAASRSGTEAQLRPAKPQAAPETSRNPDSRRHSLCTPEPAGGQTPVRLRAAPTPPGPRGTLAHLCRLTQAHWLRHREKQAERLPPPRHAPVADACLLSFPEGRKKNPSPVRLASDPFYHLWPRGVPGRGRLARLTPPPSTIYCPLPPLRNCSVGVGLFPGPW